MYEKEGSRIDALKLSSTVEHYVIQVRRHLHQYPELSMQEEKTIQFVTEELKRMDIPFTIVPDGGIIGKIEGEKPGRTLILRADLDALPMQEADVNLSQRKNVVSKIDGVAHTCGHDAHTAMLLGAADILRQHKESLFGTVLLVFEQGEEIGGGIHQLLEQLKKIGADGIWGIHVKNDLPSGKISVEAGPRMAAVMPFDITLNGKSGHGSRPDLASSPIDCFVDLHARLSQMRLKYLDPLKPATFSIGAVHAGKAANVIPETLRFSGTFRYLHVEQGKEIQSHFRRMLAETCRAHDCSFAYNIEPKANHGIVYNDETCANIAEKAVIKAIGSETLAEHPAWMASEPFAIYQQHFPGVFAFLGIYNEEKGTGADHHNVHFDVDEDVLKLGVAVTVQYAIDYLKHFHFQGEIERRGKSDV